MSTPFLTPYYTLILFTTTYIKIYAIKLGGHWF